MKKVMVVGSSGSGKSTFARRLGQKTGIPVVHIDQLYWLSGWKMRPEPERLSLIETAVAREQWIFDGNNTSTFKLRADRADVLIFLDIPRWLCLWRVLKRIATGYGKVRVDSAPDCPERLSLPFLRWVYSYPNTARPAVLALMNEYSEKLTIFHLRGKRDVEDFFERLG